MVGNIGGLPCCLGIVFSLFPVEKQVEVLRCVVVLHRHDPSRHAEAELLQRQLRQVQEDVGPETV